MGNWLKLSLSVVFSSSSNWDYKPWSLLFHGSEDKKFGHCCGRYKTNQTETKIGREKKETLQINLLHQHGRQIYEFISAQNIHAPDISEPRSGPYILTCTNVREINDDWIGQADETNIFSYKSFGLILSCTKWGWRGWEKAEQGKLSIYFTQILAFLSECLFVSLGHCVIMIVKLCTVFISKTI